MDLSNKLDQVID